MLIPRISEYKKREESQFAQLLDFVYDILGAGAFNLDKNRWGEDNGSGSGCIGVDSPSGDKFAWHATWSWSGGAGKVKSYQNALPTNYTPAQLCSFPSIPSTWDWSYTSSDLIADVAYDIFTGSSATGSAEFEIMIWLAALGGAGPISSSGSAITNPTIRGNSWKLFQGTNAATTVFIFVAASEIQSYYGDLIDFFNYLVSHQGFSTSQYVQSIGAGTEPFTGSNAVFTTTAYTLSI
ncbi:xyloglucanase 2 [Talaromyces proteolyticus]|uniref:xyloglucan-specific endo-beta-1,4-glucanase n=1 Tax=Talaromyces proteolyticus TaxID=1131652 RepID=A0AAD4Q434_9EURO|nr:xyloglucanase 2 [Talaromyces proteolyticus]KAH8702443.1 xyloglucanase 2 [Talaromyces proteolyticus]